MLTQEQQKKMGRPRIGQRRKLTITLPDEMWDHMDRAIDFEDASSPSDYFRQLIQNAKQS